ncbi:MAG: glucose-6-phosphate isomerase [gamma proteobacterium symbiont of Taylorina sp.]|nr:glucose-6-phosphate isomerase [gamma proteobacterium symbiont of Taylorina sp.]
MKNLTESSAWLALKEHFNEVKDVHMKDLFAEDSERFENFSVSLNDILFDYSKNRINENTMALLFDLARQSHIEQWRDKMFSGEAINITEKRSVLHTALRNRSSQSVNVDNQDVMPKVKSVLKQMRAFSDQVRSGQWRGYNGHRIKSVVNIGIGGSDLGPHVICDALKSYAQHDLNAYFVSNVDSSHLLETLKQIDPETTLFIIASKTFTTQETMLNAFSARKWFLDQVGDEKAIEKHFVAVTTNIELATEFGINKANTFAFWDWVGGRYSLWSAIGLTIAVYLGMDHFEALLEGADEMDQHFQDVPLEENIPVIMALLGVWYNNFFAAKSYAVIPYSQYLDRLPAFLQQLDMESNGKTVDRNGQRVNYQTGPIIWGQAGTNGQHAFFQLIHQGSQLIPTDFLIPALSHQALSTHHRVLFSNCLAQTKALMLGKNHAEVLAEMKQQGIDEQTIENILPHRVFEGNKPSNTIVFERLTPKTLGSILAMYEHKVFVQGIIWNINSFDQWGVEYGKVLAGQILVDLSQEAKVDNHDSSTNGLINHRNNIYYNGREETTLD